MSEENKATEDKIHDLAKTLVDKILDSYEYDMDYDSILAEAVKHLKEFNAKRNKMTKTEMWIAIAMFALLVGAFYFLKQ